MNSQEIVDLCKKHTMYTWTSGNKVNPLPIAGAKGVYMYTPDGTRILDFNSQLMSVNIGHGHPRVISAMKKQLDELPYIFPGAATEVRARVGRLLAEMVPGDINKFFLS